MYSDKALEKYYEKMGIALAIYKADTTACKVVISSGNKKIGRVLNVSTAPVFCCHNCKECKSLCYDIKACLQYVNVTNARAKNTVLAKYERDRYFAEIALKMDRRRKNKYFRYHVAGDILDLDYFCRMVKTAVDHPDFVIWTYTKNYNIVNEFCDKYGRDAIPENFKIMFSEWRGLPMKNPYGFPEFRVVFKNDIVKPSGYYCPGNCDICKEKCRGCIAGETVYCNEH